MTSRVVLVPGVLALLPEYAGQTDPVAELRAATPDAVGAGTVTAITPPDAVGEAGVVGRGRRQ